ncbi:hypothetical protein L0668_07790 [Paraglaciecola aquimarina]|uniref:Uncharacterized protein n=1 Tax=Paraglaciecola algarum TaxID=3050085 RepID=A0ABS9D5Q1_9ALTE|nr:hypothetical protein [Paraglaciecola sp. G1-23]MCF2948004.1 hypothetical protein [Paraglaciecola sp. G1-23]
MARTTQSFWGRNKYEINGLVLILPLYFLYQSLTPVFPKAWATQKVGTFEITPTPYDMDQPYQHEGHFTKDFLLIFSQGKVAHIRQAYFNIGEAPIPLAELQTGDEGILHGSQHGQEVHAIAPKLISAGHKAWLTIENWQGEQFITSWDIPQELQQN